MYCHYKIYTGDNQLSQIEDYTDIFVYQMDITNPDLVSKMAVSNDDGTTEDGWPVYIRGEICISILSVLCMDWTDCILLHSQLSIRRTNRFIKYSSDSSTLRTSTVTTRSTRGTSRSLRSRTMPSTRWTDDDDMLSDVEEVRGPLKIFSFHLVDWFYLTLWFNIATYRSYC